MMKIGVLSLQGDFSAHAKAVEKLGSQTVLVKTTKDLDNIGGLIMPGGESTALIRLLERSGLQTALTDAQRHGLPIFGTCAGLILIANQALPQKQFCFGFIPVEVERNAYGSQKDSFVENIPIPAIGPLAFPCFFIRAPKIATVSPDVEILARQAASPILIRYRNVLGATFHPELSDDLRVHALFLRMCGIETKEVVK